MAAGILAFGPHHGGDIESCMRFLDGGLTLMRGGETLQQAADAIVDECVEQQRDAARASAIASTRAIRARRGCFRWRWSSSSKASTCG